MKLNKFTVGLSLFVLLLVVVPFVSLSGVSAEELSVDVSKCIGGPAGSKCGSDTSISEMIATYPIPNGGTSIMFNDVRTFYTVSLDGEGEAFVSMKIKLAILDELKTGSFEIPGRSVRVLGAVQEYTEARNTCSYTLSDGSCSYYYKQYDTPKYYSAVVVAEQLSESSKVSITLPKPFPLPSNVSESSVIVLYKVEDVAVKSGGVFSFDFKTPKFSRDVSYSRVSTTVVSPYILKGSPSASVDYRGNAGMALMETSAMKFDATQNEDIRSFSSNIEYSYSNVKEANGIDPLESFTVQGKYADSSWKFYTGWIAFGVLALIGIIVGLVALARKVVRASKKVGVGSVSTSVLVLLGSISSSVIITVTMIVLFLVMTYGYSWFGYQAYAIVTLFAMLLSFLITIAALVIPPLLIGLKKGPVPAVVTVLATLGFLIVFFIIGAIILVMLGTIGRPAYLY